jgi:hypothetical protein
MKAALALIFFACIAGSMAADARLEIFDQLLAQGQGILATILQQVQLQAATFIQQALGQLTSLVGSFGGRFLDFDFSTAINALQSILNGNLAQIFQQILGQLPAILGGRASFSIIAEHFQNFINSITPALTGLGQHFLNQGLAAVLGGLGNLGGRGVFDSIFGSLGTQLQDLMGNAQTAITGVLGGLQTLGSNLLDAAQPHWEQLQEQLIGHGLNVLGSLSETINNLHGSITGGN